MDFEAILKVITMAVAAVGIPVAAYAAVAATRSIWGRLQPSPDEAGAAEVAALRERVQELEGLSARVMELEERLDFAERMLVQDREVGRLVEGKETV